MRCRRVTAFVVGALALLAMTEAHAIDAARSLRPMVYIPEKAAPVSNDVDKAVQQTGQQGDGKAVSGKSVGNTRGSPTGKSSSAQALPPGSVVRDTASGKPFVAVKSNGKCEVSAAAGDLETQLRACAGVKP